VFEVAEGEDDLAVDEIDSLVVAKCMCECYFCRLLVQLVKIEYSHLNKIERRGEDRDISTYSRRQLISNPIIPRYSDSLRRDVRSWH
jgi:hypothetical protein